MERVADRELPGVDQADDVAGVGLVDRLAVAAEEAVGARRRGSACPARLFDDRHVLGEPARADAHERDAVAMARIHVRLDLEHEAGEALVGRLDDAGVAGARLRRRRELDQRAQERLEAEVGQRAAEEHRRLPAGAVLGDVERRAGAADDVERLAEMRVGVLADQLARAADRRAPTTSTGARYCPCASRS